MNDQFCSPDNSEWVLGVDLWGAVFIIDAPNIHPALLEDRNAEMAGLPCELDVPPGVYRVICDYYENRCWETGVVDDWEFEIKSMEVIEQW